jgi:PEP-CTERM motif
VKFSRLFVLLVLVGLTASAAMADGIDPTVVIRQVDPPPVAITDPFGTIGVFATASQNVFAFQNDTGETLVSLSVTLFGLNLPLDFSFGENAGDGIFADTSVTENSNGSTTLLFSGLDADHTGLLPADCSNGGLEFLAANPNSFCPQCTGGVYSLVFDFTGVPSGALVVGAATVSAPEPGTLILLSAGMVGLFGLRKRKAALQN